MTDAEHAVLVGLIADYGVANVVATLADTLVMLSENAETTEDILTYSGQAHVLQDAVIQLEAA